MPKNLRDVLIDDYGITTVSGDDDVAMTGILTAHTLKVSSDPVDAHGIGDVGFNDLRYVPKNLDATTSTDPALNAAVSTAIIDGYGGVIITLTGTGNAQTLQNPTDTAAIKRFIVVSDDGNSTYTIEVNGITMSAGEAQWFIWDGSAWVAITAVDANDIAFTPAGNIVATDVQTAIEELDTEKAPVSHTQTASTISDFDVEVANNTAVAANTLKDTNVSTDLSEGTNTVTTVDVNSSDGTNATLLAASTSRAGLLTKAKFDEIVVNNAKTGVTTEISNLVEDTTPQLGGDLDCQGNYALDLQNIQDLNANGPSYWFNGIDGYISTPANSNFILSDGDMSIVLQARLNEIKVTDQYLVGFGNASAGQAALLGVQGNAGKLFLSAYTAPKVIDTVKEMPVDKDMYIGVAYSGGSATFYYNGGALSTQSIALNVLVGHFAIGRPLDLDALYAGISTNKSLIFNLKLTDDEMLEYSNGAPVPFKYLGANQTDILSGWDFTSGWSTIVATISDSDTFVSTQVGGAVYKDYGLTLGKSYRICIAGTVSTGNLEVRLGGTGDQIIYDGLSGTFDETIEFTCEYLGELRLRCTVSSSTVDITTLELTQIGCILQMEQSGIGNSQWLDNSGNELHGEVSGALACNLPQNHNEVYRHTVAITGDTTFTDVIPAGYLLESITFFNAGVGACILDFGTTSGAHDLFQNQTIQASGITVEVINAAFSATAAQSLFLNDDSTPGWTNVSLEASFLMKRIC